MTEIFKCYRCKRQYPPQEIMIVKDYMQWPGSSAICKSCLTKVNAKWYTALPKTSYYPAVNKTTGHFRYIRPTVKNNNLISTVCGAVALITVLIMIIAIIFK